MARYIDADKLIEEYDRVHIGAPGGARKLMVEAPTVDVVPKSEVTKTLSDIKRQIHEKAIYPHNAGIKPYISVREVDAIIQDKLKHMEERRE
jgi:hypothetical protein